MKRLTDLASKHELKDFEDAWIDVVASDSSDVNGLLQAIDALEAQGHFGKASQFLTLLLDTYVKAEDDDKALLVLRRLAKLGPRNQNLRKSYLTVLRRRFADHEGLESLIAHSEIETTMEVGKAAERLESYLHFRPGSYVEHPAGWGVGTVASVNADDATVTIDFDGMKGHELEMDMAVGITRPLASDDFRAMKFDRLHELKELAENNPVELVRCVVDSRARQTTVRDLRHTLTEGVIPAKDWSKWWSKVRTHAKRDPNLKISTGSNPVIEITHVELDFSDQTLNHMSVLRDLPRKIKYVRELLSELEAHPETRSALLVAAGVLAKSARDERKRYPGATLSVALILERVSGVDDGFTIPEELQIDRVLDDPWRVIEILDTVPVAADRKDVLSRLKKRFPEEWPEVFEKAMYLGESDVNDYCMRKLIEIGAFDRLTRVIFDLIKKFRDYRGSFLWFTKLVLKGNVHKALPNPNLESLLEKTFLLHAHVANRLIQTNDAELKKEIRAIEKLLTAKNSDFVRRTARDTLIESAVDFYNIVRGSRSLPDDVKDTVVAALLRTRPEIAKERIREEQAEEIAAIDERVIWVTAAGYLKFETEYNKLVNDDIPANAQEIGRAASYGDLSENAEWSAAIEKQAALSRKAEEMREALEKARVLDDSIVTDQEVAVGCRVRVRNLDADREESYTLLGPWDVDMERGIISYLAPLGRALLGRTVGGEVLVNLPNGQTRYRVEAIEVAKKILDEQQAS
ncbi:MAG: GreA/GreB family elongation factor [Planctomycetota bacterium]